MRPSPRLFVSSTSIITMLMILSVLAGCRTYTARRGFSEPSRFAGMLKPNPKTSAAGDRGAPTLSIIELQADGLEITRHSEKTFPLKLSKQPLLALVQAEVWHRGVDLEPLVKPSVSVNCKKAGALEPFWPSLAQRNYVFFLWDRKESETINYAADYQGWLKASCFISGDLFRAGDNSVSIATELDQIKIKDMTIELLYGFDGDDTIYDFRRKTRQLPLPITDKQ